MAEVFRVLERDMLLELVYPVVESRLPLLSNMKRHPKLIWLDTGLVNYQAGIRTPLFSTSEVMDMWRGRVGEQVVAQELLAYNHRVLSKRFFWSRDKKGGSAEVDFVVSYQGLVIPIEVKTGHNSKLKSLHSFMDQVEHHIAVRVWSQPLSVDKVCTASGKEYSLINLPFYYLSQLGRIIDKVLSE